MIRILALIALLFVAAPALAQDTEQADRSYFIGFVENQLSGPDRQIRINNIQGALSSDATIGEITIADSKGVWLRITNARIVWTRSALILGRLDIATLGAERIDILRRPAPAEGAPPPEAGGFKLPELPLSVSLGALDVPHITFGEGVFGLASEMALTGRLQLADGSLDAAIDATRLDGPGGKLNLSATYANASQELNLDFGLAEPANGIVANALGIDGRPPMALTLKGQGPLAALDLALALDADGARVLTGTTRLRESDAGLTFATTVEGPISRLISPRLRSFFGTDTSLTASGVVKSGGGVTLDALDLKSAALTISAAADTASDGFLQRLKLDATIADPDPARTVLLPVPGSQTTLRGAKLAIDFGGSSDGAWTGAVDVDDLSSDTFAARKTSVALSGVALNLSVPTERKVSFKATGGVFGIVAKDAAVAKALGDAIKLDIGGDWSAGQPIRLDAAQLSANGFSLGLAGQIAEYAFRGTIGVKAASAAPFSGLARRELGGSLALNAKGDVKPLTGAFDLTLDGTAGDLTVGQDAADRLLAGQTRISGGIARGEDGLVARQLRIFNDQTSMTADGRFATGAADFGFDLAVTDLARVSDRLSGRLDAKGRAAGSDGLIGLTMTAAVPEGSLIDKTLRDAVLGFDGTLKAGALDGRLTGKAFLDGVRVDLATSLATGADGQAITGLRFEAGGARLVGDVKRGTDGLLAGKLSLAAADISTAAALFAQEATGAAKADIVLSHADGKQAAKVAASVSALAAEEIRIGNADLNAAASDLFGVPVIDGTVNGSDILAAGIAVSTLEARAKSSGSTTAFNASARLKNATQASVSGALAPLDGGYRVTLDTLTLRQGKLAATLTQPASFSTKGQSVTIDSLALSIGSGRVNAQGTIGDTLNLGVELAALPLDIANSIRSDLGLSGTLDGKATISGSRSAPDVTFSLRGKSIAATALRKSGISSLTVTADGKTNAQRLALNASVTSPEGVRATVNGAVPLDGGDLAVDVDLGAFPLAVLNAVVPNQSLGGALSGKARITGNIANPSATFDIRGAGVRAAALEAAGAAPLDVQAAGSYAGGSLTLNASSATGPQGLSVTARGKVPLAGSGLDVSVTASAPLALANRFLADRGAQASGLVQASATVTGSIANPSIRGMFSTVGAELVDPESNLRLRSISVLGTIDGQTVTLRNASATLSTGGTVAASGTISLDAAAAFPADIRITLNEARYADGNMVVATVSGALALTGPLVRDPLLAGTINVSRAEITVPETFAGGAAALDVQHVKPPKAVVETLRRAHANDGTPTPSSRPSVLRLDVNVTAANRIFVRGRGLDTELGGSVRLTGPVTDIQPVGGFKLIRGRLGILGQRITFDEGTVTLVGDLDPFVNFVARSAGSDITVFITVSGRVSDINVAFSSQPELPQDEVLARLIFKRGINELSAFQIAQLAAAAAELAGGSNNSLLGGLRSATGLDDLDVTTNSEGNAVVKAGRYVQDNIYLGVEAGAQGSTRGTINLDITEDLKARGAIGAGGDSSIGVFYEKDY